MSFKKRGSIFLVMLFIIIIALFFINFANSSEDKLEKMNYNIDKEEINFDNGPIKNIKFKDLSLNDKNELKIDDIPVEEIKEKKFIEVYAIDPTQINFTEAIVSAVASGTSLYKCKDWDFDNRICNGEWILFKDNLIPGQEYSFTLTPDDPAFGEIIATAAVHLDSNYSFISNIYDQIKTRDDSWSEQINNGEIVRVTFAENLTDGRMIDVYATSDNTKAYFDVYEAGTSNLVGRSRIFDSQELEYITVNSLTKPTNIFDFKVINASEINSYIKFDYIHDDVINATQATGLIVYSTSGVQTPKYRIWNDTYNFTSALNALTASANIYWTVLKSNHERNESILGTLDDTLGINIQIFNSTGWGNLKKVSSAVPLITTRSFDMGIEQLSGDVMIFYENSALNTNNQIGYIIWNGTSYSNEINFTTNLANAAINWIMAFPETGSDNIIVLIHNNANALDAQYWNGTGFDPTKNLTLSTATVSNVRPHFSYSWESSSGQGIVGYGIGTKALIYRTFSKTAPYWSTQASVATTQNMDSSRMCSDPTSDYIGIIFQDTGANVYARMWDGAQILASPPSADTQTERTGTNNNNVACAWHTLGDKALFGFIDFHGLGISNFTFTKATNTWSAATLVGISTTGSFATNYIKSLRFVSNPVTNEIMATTLDLDEDMHAIRWNRTAFNIRQSALETNTQVLNGEQENVRFDWSRYDPCPNVTLNFPNAGIIYNVGAIINISANVTDNINISKVLANITIPNGTIDQIILFQRDATTNKITYNNTFSNTGIGGTYTIKFIANDTSVFKNINQTITTTFVIQESAIAPNVTLIYPLGNSKFNATNIVNITVNVTDANVTYVFANLTMPNGTKEMLRMYNHSTLDIYNQTYTAPLLVGLYNITFMANDSSNNMNNTLITNFTVYDDLPPNVTSIFPEKNSKYNVSNNIQISINATDLWSIAQTIAAFVYPNGTLYNLTLVNKTNYANKFNNSFVIPNITGTYNITFYVNDTNNNLNNSEITNFTVTLENALTINALGCYPYYANLTQSVICNATASDETGISKVIANVTLPNGTVDQMSPSSIGNIYNFTFSNTGINNTYNIFWWVNDTDNNKATVTDNFVVRDAIEPNITLNSPNNRQNISSTSLTFNFSVIDNYATILNCSLIIDSVTNQTDSNTINGTHTSFSVSGFINRTTYQWNISCKDSSGNQNISETRSFKIDIDKPRFFLLNTTPSTEGLLDPNVVINITANVTEDTTYVDLVVIQYKLSNNTNYINLTTTYDSNLYNASFIAVQNGTYTIRLWANDSLNNNDYSNEINISVQSDRIWARSPISFTPVSTSVNTNITLGNLTINNTGDDGVNFTIISNYGTTWLNHSATGGEGNSTTNFTLAAGQSITIQVNDSHSSQGIKSVTLTITPDSGWDPVQLNTTGIIVVAPNQPILSTNFITPSAKTLTVTQGDTNVNFNARLSNVGEGNATNVSFVIDIPDDWSVILGSLVQSQTELVSGDNIENNILVNIPSNTTTGIVYVRANATATNYSESNISDFIFGDEISVTVNKLELGAQATPSGGGAVSGGTGIGGGGGGSAVKTVESFDVLRGTSKIVPIKIENIYANSILKNVKLSASGFLDQYLKISPDYLNNIIYGSNKEFNINVFVPPYYVNNDFDLKLKITGDIVAIEPNRYGVYEIKPLSIEKVIKLIVREVSGEKAQTYIDKIKNYINEFKDKNFPYSNLEKLDKEAETAFQNLDFEKVKAIEEEVEIIKQNAWYSNDLIKELQKDIKKSEDRWLNIPETNRALELAITAFKREDFSTAVQRAKDAQLTYILETKGRINILWFLTYYWWALILGFIIISIGSFVAYKNLIIFIINQRINNINKEEIAIESLIKDAQNIFLNKKSISESEYNRLINQYNSRLNRIRQIRLKLRNRRIGIIKTEQELKNIKNEKSETITHMKDIQRKYLEKGKMNRNEFFRVDEQDKRRLSEIEEEEQVLKEKLEKQKITKQYKILKWIDNIKFKKKGKYHNKWIVLKIKDEKK